MPAQQLTVAKNAPLQISFTAWFRKLSTINAASLPAVMLPPAKPELSVTAHAAVHSVVWHPQCWARLTFLHSFP